MKKNTFLRKNLVIFFTIGLFLSSCVEPDTGDKGTQAVKEEESAEGVAVDRPEDTVIPVRGVFYTPNKGCKEGFGLCEVQILPPDERNVVLDTLLEEEAERLINGYFRIAPNEEEVMRIEFLERVPNWGDEFVVDSLAGPYTDITGYESVRPLPGIYEPSKDMGQYGGVIIKIEAVKEE